ncbi:hypothetical protein [Magnetospira sp. QH-2]|uniref:hypothetical protein n=1 Tax=Magnetospira sp. (strain QH-2) TaxID=1288970 RepID=UPI0003E81014|nr:hypothetical protein [Magnetospira sp. QH-2]CCQ72431.1 protein of unknown function [Magnetospira sp. QH-2]
MQERHGTLDARTKPFQRHKDLRYLLTRAGRVWCLQVHTKRDRREIDELSELLNRNR